MAQSLPDFDFNKALSNGTGVYNSVLAFADHAGVSRFVSNGPAVLCGISVGVVSFIVIGVLQLVIVIGAWFGEVFLDTLDTVRQTNKDQFNEVIAASTNEMLGTSISASQLSAGSQEGNSLENNKALGDALITIFEGALGNLQPVSPEQGAENARKFAGFSVNFATSQAFLSILAETASVGLLKEFHELPDGLMRALGLGRLQRAALAPLIRNCISQPYDLYLKGLLRPDRMSEAQLVRALRAGDLEEADVRTQLAQKGYRDSDIDILLKDLTAKLGISELSTLVRYSDLTEDQAISKLTDAGMDKDAATLLLKANLESKADSQVSGILSDLESAYTDGFIDQTTFDGILSKLPITDDEEQFFRMKVGAHQERPRKRISFAQLKAGIIDGFADFSYVDTWLQAEGYGHDDQMILTLEIIQAMNDAEAKAKAKAATAAKALAKGKQPPAATAQTIPAPVPPPNPPAPVQPTVQPQKPTT